MNLLSKYPLKTLYQGMYRSYDKTHEIITLTYTGYTTDDLTLPPKEKTSC